MTENEKNVSGLPPFAHLLLRHIDLGHPACFLPQLLDQVHDDAQGGSWPTPFCLPPFARGPKSHPKSGNTKKTPRSHELFREVRANFCLLHCDTSQEPTGNCSEKLVQMNFFIWGGFFGVDFPPLTNLNLRWSPRGPPKTSEKTPRGILVMKAKSQRGPLRGFRGPPEGDPLGGKIFLLETLGPLAPLRVAPPVICCMLTSSLTNSKPPNSRSSGESCCSDAFVGVGRWHCPCAFPCTMPGICAFPMWCCASSNTRIVAAKHLLRLFFPRQPIPP